MRHIIQALVVLTILTTSSLAWADEYGDTINTFKAAGQSEAFFSKAYGYAVFPTIGKGGLGIGFAHGKGRVYAGGKYVGDTSMNQGTIGLQMGGQAYSEIIFFEDKPAFDKFTSGNFEFGAQANAVAITAGASASTSTGGGGSTSASTSSSDASTTGGYTNGMAVFTVAKGGLMYEASIGGQKFSYEPRRPAA